MARDMNACAAPDRLQLGTDDHNGPVIGDAPDVKHVWDGYELGWPEADERSVELAVEHLTNGDPDALFVYLGNPDETSHQHESVGPEYRAAIRQADELIGRRIEAVSSRATYDQDDWPVLRSPHHGPRAARGHRGGPPAPRPRSPTAEYATVMPRPRGPRPSVSKA